MIALRSNIVELSIKTAKVYNHSTTESHVKTLFTFSLNSKA